MRLFNMEINKYDPRLHQDYREGERNLSFSSLENDMFVFEIYTRFAPSFSEKRHPSWSVPDSTALYRILNQGL